MFSKDFLMFIPNYLFKVALSIFCFFMAVAIVQYAGRALGEAKAVHPIAAVKLKVKDSNVTFKGEADGPMGIGTVGVPGEGGKIETDAGIKDGKLSGMFAVELDKFTTKESTRDAHMKEDFKTAGAKVAVCQLEPVEMKGVQMGICKPLKIGQIEKDTPIKLAFSGPNVTATLDLKLKDFAIPLRKHLGAQVHNDFQITANLVFEAPGT